MIKGTAVMNEALLTRTCFIKVGKSQRHRLKLRFNFSQTQKKALQMIFQKMNFKSFWNFHFYNLAKFKLFIYPHVNSHFKTTEGKQRKQRRKSLWFMKVSLTKYQISCFQTFQWKKLFSLWRQECLRQKS